MDAKRLAAELKETTTKTWAMWSRETTKGENGALVMSPDLLPKFFAAQANNFAAAYADRLLPYSSDADDMEPDTVEEQSLATLACVCDLSVAHVRADGSGLERIRESVREFLLVISAKADYRFKGAVDVLYLTLAHIARLERRAAEVQS